MAEETTTKTIENSNLAPVEIPASIPNNPPASTPADPGHPDYDPLKAPKVKVYTDNLFSNLAQKDKELRELKATLEGLKENLSSFEKEKREKEDAEKSELQKASDRISDLEKNITTLESQMTESTSSHSKERASLNAKYSIMNEVAKAGLKISNTEQRGLIDELEDKLRAMSDADNPEDIASKIVVEFKKERDENFSPPNTPNPVIIPAKVEPSDKMARLDVLRKMKITPEVEAEMKTILEEIDREGQ